ncbi:MAG: flagellar biosynthesis anti-sigma factor FlgM [Nitrosomonadales bacterium]|nr:flagellar biosynthesis anti-sigma factor FlgM [Nitrosomonadales bacterium]
MKIEKTSKPLPAQVGETGSRAAAARATGNKTPAGETSGTSVHLGTSTAQLRSMEGSIANTPLVDVQKVAEIKQAISDGRFQVNAGVVADRLIDTVQDLITASQH